MFSFKLSKSDEVNEDIKEAAEARASTMLCLLHHHNRIRSQPFLLDPASDDLPDDPDDKEAWKILQHPRFALYRHHLGHLQHGMVIA